MRVTLWVDALEPNPGGIGRYTWELCKGLEAHDEVGPLKFYGRQRLIEDPAALLRGDPLPRRRNRVWRWWESRQLRSGIFHGPNYFLPEFVEQGIITVHDLSVFRFPETHPAERVRAFERDFDRSLSRAKHVITDTETVRAELIGRFSLPPERVTAVPLGVDPAFRPRSKEELLPALGSINLQPGAYGLCVSTMEPRKKISELLMAWRRLPIEIRDRWPLVVAGGAGWRNEAIQQQIKIGVAEGWLRYLGFVDEELLPALYAGAALVVYPSIYEGFGLPLVEAMASGVPVVTSNRSCLPEVCGDAAMYVDPDDKSAFLACLTNALTDHAWREAATRLGQARASLYSWDRCIEGTVEIYRKVAVAT